MGILRILNHFQNASLLQIVQKTKNTTNATLNAQLLVQTSFSHRNHVRPNVNLDVAVKKSLLEISGQIGVLMLNSVEEKMVSIFVKI